MANIVWDIDGVLVDLEKYLLKTAPSFFEKKFNKKIVNPNSISLREMFDCTKEQEEMFWKYNLNLLTYSLFEKTRYGIKEVMDKIHEDGDKNIICTARAKCDEDSIIGKVMRQAVSIWISKNNLPIDDIYFVPYKNSAEEKLKVCRKVNATVMIDDDVNNTTTISKEFPTIVYSSDYNENVTGENIHHVKCADEIYLEISKIKNETRFQDFKFLTREEREALSLEELEDYYEKYRQVMMEMPYDEKTRKSQTEKYHKIYKPGYFIHSLVTPKTILLNPEMLENLKENYKEGKIFILGSHTSLDDIQQIQKITDEMSFFLVKNEFSKYPIVGKFLKSVGCEYVQRDDQDSRIFARKQLEKLVFHDNNVIILPEGTRNRTNNVVGKFEIGASSIAQRTGSYIVPVAIKRYKDQNEVYLKICEPRKVSVNDDLEIVTKNLQDEMANEIISIEEHVKNDNQPKRYFKKKF
ncbi:MAG: 1-acyl-sn-glycerol-3-phosphate acyltransferase [Bacilli bacterium]|nr:1-acyl-sn-glycerol-3-phosphate acyltransferase [Bacilli bacterium]